MNNKISVGSDEELAHILAVRTRLRKALSDVNRCPTAHQGAFISKQQWMHKLWAIGLVKKVPHAPWMSMRIIKRTAAYAITEKGKKVLAMSVQLKNSMDAGLEAKLKQQEIDKCLSGGSSR